MLFPFPGSIPRRIFADLENTLWPMSVGFAEYVPTCLEYVIPSVTGGLSIPRECAGLETLREFAGAGH